MNIFLALEKYAPRANYNPKENFFTNAFAYILNDNQKTTHEFVKLLLRDRNISLSQSQKFWIDVQCKIDAGIIDLFVDASPIKIYIECKLQSKENKGEQPKRSQLRHYLKCVKKAGPKVYLAYITLHEDKPADFIRKDSRFLGHFLWSDIFEELQQPLKSTPLGKQFIKYMEDKRMKKTKLTIEDLEVFPKATICMAKLQKMRDDLVKYFKTNLGSTYVVIAAKKDHIGLEFSESWIGFKLRPRKIAKRKDIHFWTGFSVYARPHECVKGYFSIELGIPSELRFHKKLFDQAFQTYKDGEVCFFDESSNWFIVSWTLNRKNIKQILSQKLLPNKQIKSLATRIDKAMQKLMRTKAYKHMIESK